jgi:manganese/zinc/iron transport system permease protein
MFDQIRTIFSEWGTLDTWIVVTGALASMSCALPGAWLFLRRQSLLGDALSHSILPGIVLAYLAMNAASKLGWIPRESNMRHLVIFFGAATSGVVSAIMTDVFQRWGRLDRSAAIGVVFTSMFALGLLLIRMFADQTHVDPGCVLYGSLETSADIVFSDRFPVPQAVVVNTVMFCLNGLLMVLFFRELRLSTFDPGFAGAIGLNSGIVQLVLMAATAGTLVSAFESVGAILVVAMLVIPPSTARLLSDRLPAMLIFSLLVAAISAILGYLLALILPRVIFQSLGYAGVHDASIAGMMALASGALFVLAIVFSPRHGLLRRLFDQARLRYRIAADDLLGMLYRKEELADQTAHPVANNQPGTSWIERLVQWKLRRDNLIVADPMTVRLTEDGRRVAKGLVRSHRLWEAYMAKHFHLPEDHLHATAEQVEHYLSPELQSELAAELDQPDIDPHGKSIPG